ncbi:dihydrolipoyl dehydrogenase family protein [Synoicihabitans lomoniglobus]|uniref:NAD(P)/FAD-dependent oxidoreductase n=1 Tax=Synoicihabitans lomoniglobus TaxID=2909285 RepID=A0AAF0I404_9BACT|nr:NAD(P)/FAD-dependent oxidoreductase [Opitutaceae bacterium LMO-M01]WED67347.1 NAD(P)/FAD-dependent oxidoreductase [Opitutaceae bacterium LMO-M01]
MKTFDFIAIGGGSAGFNAARVAADLGKKVAVVDGAKTLGGLCILKGCMPSKTLLYATDVLHLAQHGRDFGLKIPSARVDMKRLHARKRAIIGEFADYRQQAMTSGKYSIFRESARFLDADTVELADGTKLRGKRFIIGTGSRVAVPPIPGLSDVDAWTSDDVLDLDHVPESVIVLGGGIVACELGQFLRRIGSRVVLIQRSPNILKDHSPAASEVVQQAFRDDGIDLHTDTKIESISRSARGISVRFRSSGRIVTRHAKHLFNALGRSPNTDGLDLEKAGVKLSDDGRIKTNRWQQTSQSHIYAGGDVCGPHDIVHLAVAQGELAARHAFGVKALKPIDPALLLNVVFTDPPLASIGIQESELQENNVPYAVATYPFDDHGKSILMNATRGYVKVIADRKRGRVLGAEIAGSQAGELIHCFSTPLAMKATVHDMLKAPWYHPTLAEILTYPLEDIAEQITAQ